MKLIVTIQKGQQIDLLKYNILIWIEWFNNTKFVFFDYWNVNVNIFKIEFHGKVLLLLESKQGENGGILWKAAL